MRLAAVRRRLRVVGDAWTAGAGPSSVQAAGLLLLLVLTTVHLLRGPTVQGVLLLLLGLAGVPALLRLRARERQEHRPPSPDVRRPD